VATQGPNNAGTVANDASAGTNAWSNPTNAQGAPDGTPASANSSSPTQYLKATNFGFSIPGGSTINGVTVELYNSTAAGGCFWLEIKLVKGGAIGGTSLADGTALQFPGYAYKTFGGSANLWGNTLTVADVNASNFGVAVRIGNGGKGTGTGYVDQIRITITYTAGGGGGTVLRQAAMNGLGRGIPLGLGG